MQKIQNQENKVEYPSSENLLIIVNSYDKNKSQLNISEFEYLEKNGQMPNSVNLKCIDGRADKQATSIGIPGAGMGVLLDFHTAMHELGVKFDDVSHKKLIQIAAKFFNQKNGKISAHTDDHALGQFFAGCGHCLGILKNIAEHEYNTSAETIAFIESLAKDDFDIVTYGGAHAEMGVVIINDQTTIMPSYILNHESDMQVFVYNKVWHEMIVKKLSEKIAEHFDIKAEALELKVKSFIDISKSTKGDKSRIMATTTRLALDKGINVVVLS